MKRLSLFIVSLMLTAPFLMGGGLVTNTNQSAAWARTLTREASTGIDAIYYNPAGLAKLPKNGIHLSVNNQSIFQTRTVTNNYPLLSPTPKSYEAELTAPLYPSIYAAFKTDKWTFSGAFNLIGGGGTADFEQGLPDFEIPVSQLVPYISSQLAPLDAAVGNPIGDPNAFSTITGYNMDASFSGSSMYYGIQLGATYAITDWISVALGGRYVRAKNTYEGSLTNITIDAPAAYGGTMAAGDYGRTLAAMFAADPITSGLLLAAAEQLDVATVDQTLSATQTGSGFTPIIGVNVSLFDMLNIGAKYEHHTKIELTNDTPDDLEPPMEEMFPDGIKVRGDLPGMFSLGAELSPIDKLVASVGFNYFLDKGAFYGKVNDAGEQINNETTIDNNSWTMAASLQYRMIGPLGISAGYSFGNLGVNDGYQSGISYANQSSTIAGGLFLEIGELLTINAGYVHVMYSDYDKNFSDASMPGLEWTETYGKKTGIIAIGVDISL
jgi:long-subunit fatty acid transport protein